MLWVGTSWKMNGTLASASEYGRILADQDAREWEGVQPFVIPPFTAIATFKHALGANSPVLVGAQNAHWEDPGAWTGEVSVLQAADAGAQLIEVGHSERREHFGETDAVVRRKVEAILRSGLRPLLCVGEPEDVFRAGASAEFILEQAESATAGLDSQSVLLAYEPIWAIGEHGRNPETAELAPALEALAAEYGSKVEAILYGGSVNQKNAKELLELQGVEGLFVGRAAWNVDGYLELLRIASAHARSGQPNT